VDRILSARLLPLRQDLRLHESGSSRDGAPQWTIQDPVRNRFFRIGWLEYECLLQWSGTAEDVAAAIAGTTPLAVEEADVTQFAHFLAQNHLLLTSSEALTRRLGASDNSDWRDWRWWLHHYLFFRIPVLRPQHLLAKLLPFLQPLLGWRALYLVLAATFVGLLLVARQWDLFTSQVGALLHPDSVFGFLLAIAFSKFLHEMGHAVVATQLGLRVSHMGVAFMVLWPMLYTDTGESWRLGSSRQRLAISIAGVATELALAGLATLLWCLLDDGALRQAMLYLATTGWVLSLALNISPFMRFDGYFVLSDLLDFPNLHERAAAVARAWLRRSLLGLDEPCPEPFTRKEQHWLVVFALATWLYRALVFIGIALAVYMFFFKVLGLFLLCVELLWFVVLPVLRELRVWVHCWPQVVQHRRLALALLLGTGLLPLAWPWAWDVHAPAVARPVLEQTVFASQSGQLLYLQSPGPVTENTLLLQLQVPSLLAREQANDVALESLNRYMGGLAASIVDADNSAVARGVLQERLEASRALSAESAMLAADAPFAGIWLDVDPSLAAGVWVAVGTPVGLLVDPGQWLVDAYVEERDIGRLEPGAPATFFIEGRLQSFTAKLMEIAPTRTRNLEQLQLDQRYGGEILATAGEAGEAVPERSLYRIRLSLDEPLPDLRQTRGHVAIEGARTSVLWQSMRTAIAVLIRESGF